MFLKLPQGEKGELVLFDILGRPILKKQLVASNTIQLMVAEGIYVWKIILSNGTHKEGKLIIKAKF